MADQGEKSELSGSKASNDQGENSSIRKEDSGNIDVNSEIKGESFGNENESKIEISESKEEKSRDGNKTVMEPGNDIVSISSKNLDESNAGRNVIKSDKIYAMENTSKSDKNKLEEVDSNKISIRNLSLLKKEHKNLNSQLHIFSHKVQYNIEPIKKKIYTSNSVEKQIVLPKIQNKNLTSKKDNNISNAFGVGKYILSNPKFKYEDTKNKILKSKEILEENKQNRLKQAKEMKEANRLLRENIFILKEKVKEENRQKKKIVESRFEFIKSSISNFKLLKQKYIKNNLNNDIEREAKEILEKQSQLETLKELHEKNKNSKNNKITAKCNANTNDASNPENEAKTSNSEEESEGNNIELISNNDEEQ